MLKDRKVGQAHTSLSPYASVLRQPSASAFRVETKVGTPRRRAGIAVSEALPAREIVSLESSDSF